MSEADEDINNQVGDLPFKAAKNKGSKGIRSLSCMLNVHTVMKMSLKGIRFTLSATTLKIESVGERY
jgi:hypothetical protein